MTAVVTSPQSAGTWARFGAFLRRPELPARATGPRVDALPVLGKLFALDLLLMSALMALVGIVLALGFELPGHLLESMELGPSLLIFMLVGAPIGEEILFRGWLSGRPAHAWAVVLLFLASLGLAMSRMGASPLLDPSAGSIVFGGGLVLALAVAWRGRRQTAARLFRRHFRWFYLLSTLAFASVHLANFAEGNALVLLPLTLPQFALGLILGYARVQFGLWASVLLHMAHNALFVGLLLVGAS